MSSGVKKKRNAVRVLTPAQRGNESESSTSVGSLSDSLDDIEKPTKFHGTFRSFGEFQTKYSKFAIHKHGAESETTESSDVDNDIRDWEGLAMNRAQPSYVADNYGAVRTLVLTERPTADSWTEIWNSIDRLYEVSRFFIHFCLTVIFLYVMSLNTSGQFAYESRSLGAFSSQLTPES